MSPYPIGYEADFVEERSRLTTFFRYIMAIPVFLVAMVYGIGLAFTVVIAWFALLFTGRYPEGLYNFNAGVLRYFNRMNGYTRLLTDAYPPFDLAEHPEYPVRCPIGPPKESYSRVKVAFRIILAIPVMLINYALSILANVCTFLSWLVIVVTGKQNKSLQDAINLATSYGTRGGGYFFLLTEDWPPFSVQEAPAPEATSTTQPDPGVPPAVARPEYPQPSTASPSARGAARPSPFHFGDGEGPRALRGAHSRGTISVLEAARQAGVKRVVQASTIWVYSDVDAESVDEQAPLCSVVDLDGDARDPLAQLDGHGPGRKIVPAPIDAEGMRIRGGLRPA